MADIPTSPFLPLGKPDKDDETSTIRSGSTDHIAPSELGDPELKKKTPKSKRSFLQESLQTLDKVVKESTSELAAEFGLTKKRPPKTAQPESAAVVRANSHSSSSSSLEAPQASPVTAATIAFNPSVSTVSVKAKLVTPNNVLRAPAEDIIRPYARDSVNDLLLEEARHVKKVAAALRNMRLPILPVVSRDKTDSARPSGAPTDIEVEAIIDSEVGPLTLEMGTRTCVQINEWLNTLMTHDLFFPGMMMVSAQHYDNMTEEQVADSIVEQGVLGSLLALRQRPDKPTSEEHAKGRENMATDGLALKRVALDFNKQDNSFVLSFYFDGDFAVFAERAAGDQHFLREFLREVSRRLQVATNVPLVHLGRAGLQGVTVEAGSVRVGYCFKVTVAAVAFATVIQEAFGLDIPDEFELMISDLTAASRCSFVTVALGYAFLGRDLETVPCDQLVLQMGAMTVVCHCLLSWRKMRQLIG